MSVLDDIESKIEKSLAAIQVELDDLKKKAEDKQAELDEILHAIEVCENRFKSYSDTIVDITSVISYARELEKTLGVTELLIKDMVAKSDVQDMLEDLETSGAEDKYTRAYAGLGIERSGNENTVDEPKRVAPG